MINKELAKAIIHKLGSYGTPPEFGLEYYTGWFRKIFKSY
jgi:hypothetical protein